MSGLLDTEARTCPDCGKEWDALVIWSVDLPCGPCGMVRYRARIAEVNEGRPYRVESIGGACPTQADGFTATGRPFYFRARHGDWTLELGPHGAPAHYPDWPRGTEELIAEGDDPSGGFMEWDDVLAILDERLGDAS